MFVLDTNGNGKRDAYVEADQPVDPTKDKRVVTAFYGVAPEPNGDAVWGSVLGMPGSVVRLTLGSNPPETALAEVYDVPFNESEGVGLGLCAARHGRGQQQCGVDGALERPVRELRSPQVQGSAQRTDRDGRALPRRLGVLYASRARTSRAGSIPPARRARTTTSSIASTCSASARTFRLRPATNRKRILALVDGKFLTFRVPYPMGYYGKGLDGRIDDPKGGWKGKGLWATYATRAPFHAEGGKGTLSKALKFQVRPNPLSK